MSRALSDWWRALRAYSFSATIIPVVCAFLYAESAGLPVDWRCLPLMLGTALLLHAGVNLLNDYYDFVLGFDTPESKGSSGLLVEKRVSPEYMLNWGRLYIAAGAGGGLLLALLRGWWLIPAGLAAVAGAWFYSHRSGYKYKGLGEPLVFLLMGPLLFCVSGYVASQTLSPGMMLFSLLFGCMVTAILLANNIRDMEIDAAAGFITLPMRSGLPRAKRMFTGLIVAAYIILLTQILFDKQYAPTLLALASLPLARRLTQQVQQALNPQLELADAPQKTAALYLVFGVLLAAGLALSSRF